MTFEIVLVGVFVGFFSGLFGKGGSAIATPLLQLVGVPAFFAVASPLPAAIPGTLVAAYAYYRAGILEKKVVLWGIAVGVPATIFGSYMSKYVGGRNLLMISDGLLIVMGLAFLLPELFAKFGFSSKGERSLKTELYINAVIATFVGFISGVLANAGGFLLAPLYRKVLRLPLKSAFSCSLLVASALAIPGTVVHAALGHIDWKVVVIFGIGSIPLSYLGAQTAIRLPVAKLEPLFGGLLTVIGTWGIIELLMA